MGPRNSLLYEDAHRHQDWLCLQQPLRFLRPGDKRRVQERRSFRTSRAIWRALRRQESGRRLHGRPSLHPVSCARLPRPRAWGLRPSRSEQRAHVRVCGFLRGSREAGANFAVASRLPSETRRVDACSGAWKRVVAGIQNLKRQGLFVLTNSVVTKQNFQDMPDLARLGASRGGPVPVGVRPYRRNGGQERPRHRAEEIGAVLTCWKG